MLPTKEGECEKYDGKKKNQGERESWKEEKDVSRVKESLGEWRFPLHTSQLVRFHG